MSDNKNRLPEIRIRGVALSLKEDLDNISKNEGVSLSTLLKPQLRQFRDSFPEYMRKKRDN